MESYAVCWIKSGCNKFKRTYFETNYRTTRKVVEDLLIEEIIQKSFRLRGGLESDDSMSKTLLEMKAKGVTRFGIGYKSTIQIMEQCESI